MGYNIAVCDDDKYTCIYVEEMLYKIFDGLSQTVNVDIFYAGESFINYISKGANYDFLILDIELMELNGVDVGHILREKFHNLQTQIIYISSKTKYALELFKVQPLDFLEKPIEWDEMEKALQRGMELLGDINNFFEYSIQGKTFRLPYHEIYYFESMDRQIKIASASKNDIFYSKLQNIQLGLPTFFCRVHKSYIVNVNAIVKCGYSELLMKDGSVISIGRRYRDDIRKLFLRGL